MKENRTIQERLQRLYGPAPESCREEMRETCAQFKEEPKMKRISSIAFAFAVTLLLAGAALAAHRLGTFDFLFPDQKAPETLQEQRQTNFTRQGGTFESVDIAVRDAISDGISAFMAVEFKAKHPGDVLLSEFDSRTEKGLPEGKGRNLVLWQDGTVGDNLFLAGQDWQAPDDQTIVLHYVIDLMERHTPDEALDIVFSPGIRLLDAKGAQRELERNEVRVTVQTGPMDQVVKRLAAPLRNDALQITFTNLEVVFTPLATYLRASYDVDAQDEASLDLWAQKYGNLWFSLEDANRNEYGMLTGGRKYGGGDASPYQETVAQTYERMNPVTDTVVLIPHCSDTQERFDAVTIMLEEGVR